MGRYTKNAPKIREPGHKIDIIIDAGVGWQIALFGSSLRGNYLPATRREVCILYRSIAVQARRRRRDTCTLTLLSPVRDRHRLSYEKSRKPRSMCGYGVNSLENWVVDVYLGLVLDILI